MNTLYTKHGILKQYLISIGLIIIIGSVCYLGAGIIGYRSVALLLLATVSVLAIFLSVYPVLVAATLSALIWDFFFIPPHFTFHIQSSEDVLMLCMYFIVALINGVLTSKIKQFQKLELQKEERQNTIKLYKTLFDSISHELRTPIATIVGASDNLLQKNPNITENDKSNLFNEISIAAFRLNRLIDNLLNMQRLESGFLKAKMDWCDISELINCPINRLKNELINHKVNVQIQSDFPMIKLDFGLIEQAIFNILHNASIYTPANTEISIACEYKEEQLTIIISDSGNGFTEEELNSVFTKFYRVNKKNTGGTGLGLSIAKGFIESHSGKIKVENNIPHGAKFTIEIPCERLYLNDDLDFTNLTLKETVHHEHKNEYLNH
jgi:two-component system sensor histidine kinase KdpD